MPEREFEVPAFAAIFALLPGCAVSGLRSCVAALVDALALVGVTILLSSPAPCNEDLLDA